MNYSKFSTFVVKNRCEQKLKIEFRSGKEFNGWFVLNNIKIARITIPKGRKSIPPKTYKAMAKQLKLNVAQFDDLLNCPLGYDEYVTIIKHKAL